MRRFEFVEGTSAKFWMADVEGTNFVVVFGRLGTAGQRKEKAFASADAARHELEKKVGEKLREGYHEVAADAAGPAGAKGADAASPALHLPARLHLHEATPARVEAAARALAELEGGLGGRSWQVGRKARAARRALKAISGADPAALPALRNALESVLKRVVSPRSDSRLGLGHALDLLYQLDAHAFARAAELWAKPPPALPAAKALAVLEHELAALGEPELALRLGRVLLAPGDAWRRPWAELRPHLESYLVQRHSSLRKHLAELPAAEPGVAARAEALRPA